MLQPRELHEAVDVGDEVFFIGYPKGHYDHKHLVPIVRRGTTATPLELDYDGKPEFLIDAGVFPGSSGSPVFTGYAGMRWWRNGTFGPPPALWFLGVLSKRFVEDSTGNVLSEEIPSVVGGTRHAKVSLGLGVVTAGKEVFRAIESSFACRSKG